MAYVRHRNYGHADRLALGSEKERRDGDKVLVSTSANIMTESGNRWDFADWVSCLCDFRMGFTLQGFKGKIFCKEVEMSISWPYLIRFSFRPGLGASHWGEA